MVNKNTRFLKKALKALPKLSRTSLIKFCEELIYEHYNLLNIIEGVAVGVYLKDQIVFASDLYNQYLQEMPNIVLSTEVGVQSILDTQKNDRVVYIMKKNFDQHTVIYVAELTQFFQENITTKTQESLIALETLAAGISHEIKNPLSAIDIHTQILQNKIKNNRLSVSPEIIKYLNIVQEESDRLINVLNTFLGITRKSQQPLVFTEVAQILDKSYQILMPELEQKQILLQLKIDSVPKIFTTPHILQQIILDLLRNSIEAINNQSNRTIELSLQENNTKTHIIISIDDSGCGIDSHVQYKIFDPYFTTKTEGTGLGLTLVKKMVEELDGKIFVAHSNLGGAKFELYFPISSEQKLLH